MESTKKIQIECELNEHQSFKFYVLSNKKVNHLLFKIIAYTNLAPENFNLYYLNLINLIDKKYFINESVYSQNHIKQDHIQIVDNPQKLDSEIRTNISLKNDSIFPLIKNYLSNNIYKLKLKLEITSSYLANAYSNLTNFDSFPINNMNGKYIKKDEISRIVNYKDEIICLCCKQNNKVSYISRSKIKLLCGKCFESEDKSRNYSNEINNLKSSTNALPSIDYFTLEEFLISQSNSNNKNNCTRNTNEINNEEKISLNSPTDFKAHNELSSHLEIEKDNYYDSVLTYKQVLDYCISKLEQKIFFLLKSSSSLLSNEETKLNYFLSDIKEALKKLNKHFIKSYKKDFFFSDEFLIAIDDCFHIEKIITQICSIIKSCSSKFEIKKLSSMSMADKDIKSLKNIRSKNNVNYNNNNLSNLSHHDINEIENNDLDENYNNSNSGYKRQSSNNTKSNNLSSTSNLLASYSVSNYSKFQLNNNFINSNSINTFDAFNNLENNNERNAIKSINSNNMISHSLINTDSKFFAKEKCLLDSIMNVDFLNNNNETDKIYYNNNKIHISKENKKDNSSEKHSYTKNKLNNGSKSLDFKIGNFGNNNNANINMNYISNKKCINNSNSNFYYFNKDRNNNNNLSNSSSLTSINKVKSFFTNTNKKQNRVKFNSVVFHHEEEDQIKLPLNSNKNKFNKKIFFNNTNSNTTQTNNAVTVYDTYKNANNTNESSSKPHCSNKKIINIVNNYNINIDSKNIDNNNVKSFYPIYPAVIKDIDEKRKNETYNNINNNNPNYEKYNSSRVINSLATPKNKFLNNRKYINININKDKEDNQDLNNISIKAINSNNVNSKFKFFNETNNKDIDKVEVRIRKHNKSNSITAFKNFFLVNNAKKESSNQNKINNNNKNNMNSTNELNSLTPNSKLKFKSNFKNYISPKKSESVIFNLNDESNKISYRSNNNANNNNINYQVIPKKNTNIDNNTSTLNKYLIKQDNSSNDNSDINSNKKKANNMNNNHDSMLYFRKDSSDFESANTSKNKSNINNSIVNKLNSFNNKYSLKINNEEVNNINTNIGNTNNNNTKNLYSTNKIYIEENYSIENTFSQESKNANIPNLAKINRNINKLNSSTNQYNEIKNIPNKATNTSNTKIDKKQVNNNLLIYKQAFDSQLSKKIKNSSFISDSFNDDNYKDNNDRSNNTLNKDENNPNDVISKYRSGKSNLHVSQDDFNFNSSNLDKKFNDSKYDDVPTDKVQSSIKGTYTKTINKLNSSKENRFSAMKSIRSFKNLSNADLLKQIKNKNSCINTTTTTDYLKDLVKKTTYVSKVSKVSNMNTNKQTVVSSRKNNNTNNMTHTKNHKYDINDNVSEKSEIPKPVYQDELYYNNQAEMQFLSTMQRDFLKKEILKENETKSNLSHLKSTKNTNNIDSSNSIIKKANNEKNEKNLTSTNNLNYDNHVNKKTSNLSFMHLIHNPKAASNKQSYCSSNRDSDADSQKEEFSESLNNNNTSNNKMLHLLGYEFKDLFLNSESKNRYVNEDLNRHQLIKVKMFYSMKKYNNGTLKELKQRSKSYLNKLRKKKI